MAKQSYSVRRKKDESQRAYCLRCEPIFYAWCANFGKERSPYTMREWDENYNSSRMINADEEFNKQLGIITQYRTIFTLVWRGNVISRSAKELEAPPPAKNNLQHNYRLRDGWAATDEIAENEDAKYEMCQKIQNWVDAKLRNMHDLMGISVSLAKEVMIQAVEESKVQDISSVAIGDNANNEENELVTV